MSQPHKVESLIGKTIFGEYTVTKKLGEGGMGAVYLATQQAIGQEIAIKVLHGRSAKNDELVKRFNREAKAVSRLTHPNIIRVFIFGRTEEGLIYLAMEFVKGTSLREEIARVTRMSEMRAITILKQTLSALSEAHDIGIIHRDLKPDNILLTNYRGEEDFVKVLDFGIAKVQDPTGAPEQKLTQAGVVYGTPEYLSPEQAQALELDHRSDVYSLGCILYEMVTGQVPFSAPTAVNILMMHVYEEVKPPRSKYAGVSPEMEKIILKAMAKKPEDRYQSAMAFFEALVGREQALVRDGEAAPQLKMPGMEVTTSFMLPPDIMEQARTAVFNSSNASGLAVANPVGQNPTTAIASTGTGLSDPRRKLLVVLIALLAVLLLVIVAGIIVLKSKA